MLSTTSVPGSAPLRMLAQSRTEPRSLPTRPYLGIDDADRREIRAVILDTAEALIR